TKPFYPEKLVLKKKVIFSPNLTYFVPVITNIDNNGVIKGNPITTNTSGDFISLANTDGFAELKKEPKIFKKGYSANLYRW
ncbi:MAG: molybdopterin molybdenumtransferase MoeA, partial [Gammaproteobacteria bacterium]|nr:molybdopterin molybdenumtransferase MoeA [Gammaproteobacteria bacterium]